MQASVGDPVCIWHVEDVQLGQPAEAAKDPICHADLQQYPKYENSWSPSSKCTVD